MLPLDRLLVTLVTLHAEKQNPYFVHLPNCFWVIIPTVVVNDVVGHML